MKKTLLVIFPYQTTFGDLHPWIKNEIKVFKKLNFKIKIFKLPNSQSLLFSVPVFVIRLLMLPILIRNSNSVLIPTSYLMFLPITLAKLFRKKVFISHLATTADPTERLTIPGFIKLITRVLDKISFNMADYILTFSETIAKEISEVQKVPSSERKFYCREVIDPEIFKPKPAIRKILRKKFNLDDKIVLFYHGKFHPFHGMEYFFEAFKTLYRKNKNLRLVILSFPKGKEVDYLDNSIIKHPGIIFLPQVKYEKLSDYLQIADLWVGRFKYDKAGDTAFSTCAVEAMACGKPIITYDNVENSRVIKDGFNGFLVYGNNADAIVKKIEPYSKAKNLAMLEKMGIQARKSAIKEFSKINLTNWLKNIFLSNYEKSTNSN